MPRSSWILLGLAVAIAAGFVGLGRWQLDRLAQRKARNTEIEASFRAPPIRLESGTAPRRFQRVSVSGTWDHVRERVIPGRTRTGSPGVHIVTPMKLDDGTEILVNRGWIYSPDARSVDLAQWHEGERGALVGYVNEPPLYLRGESAALYVVALEDASGGVTPTAKRPVRLSPPPFGDEGPHLSYAVTWFSFAAIALIGTPLLLRDQRRRRE